VLTAAAGAADMRIGNFCVAELLLPRSYPETNNSAGSTEFGILQLKDFVEPPWPCSFQTLKHHLFCIRRKITTPAILAARVDHAFGDDRLGLVLAPTSAPGSRRARPALPQGKKLS